MLHKFLGYTDKGSAADATAAIVAALAFAGVIVSLKLQSDELGATREEMKGQKEQLEAQVKALERQQRTATFFELLNLQRTTAAATVLVDHGNATGERAFVTLCHLSESFALRQLMLVSRDASFDRDAFRGHLESIFSPLATHRAGTFPAHVDVTMALVEFAGDTHDLDERRFYDTLLLAQLSAAQRDALIYWAASGAEHLTLDLATRLELLFASAPSSDVSVQALRALSDVIRRKRNQFA